VTENNLKDEEVVAKVLAGEKELFSFIVDKYEPMLMRYCLRLLGFHTQDAKDAVSNSLIKAYQNLASFKQNFKFSSWIYRIAHNEAITIWRKRQGFFSVDISSFWPISAPEKDETNELKFELLDKIFDKLNLNDKEVLTLFYLEEKPLKEISDILKLSVNTVAVRLKRARNRSKELIKKMNYAQ